MTLLAVARREVALALRTPAAWCVAALFLAVEGYSFWSFVSLLDRRAAPPESALRLFFGGSFLFWLLVMVIAVVATMRAIADERRTGTLETLLTAPVSPVEVIVGKYLGALAAYALLWLPTGGFLAILARLGVPLDGGAIAGGYLGTLLVGAGALAVGLAASSLTEHQLVAAGSALLALTGLLSAGFAVETAAPDGLLSSLLGNLQILRQMDAMARGAIDLRAVALHLGIAAVALAVAIAALGRAAATRNGRRRHALGVVVVVALALGANLVAARWPRRIDLTRGRRNTLAPTTLAILDRLDRPITATLLLSPTGSPADPYDEIRAVVDRFAARTDRFRPQLVAEADGDQVRALATRFHLGEDDLSDGGILLTDGARGRFVPRARLARFDRDGAGIPYLAALTAEEELAVALPALTATRTSEVCFTSGHDEAAIDSLAVGGASDLGDALRRGPVAVKRLPPAAAVPASCDLLVIAGPQRPFSVDEAAAIDAFLAAGRPLLALLGPGTDPAGAVGKTGLEELLAHRCIAVRDRVVLDPGGRAGRDGAWVVDDGYGAHPIVRDFGGGRTIWSAAREIAPLPSESCDAVALVHAGEQGFASPDPRAPFSPSGAAPARDATRFPSVAVASDRSGGPPRIVVLGSRDLARNDHDAAYNRAFLVAAVAWLVGPEARATIPPAPPPRIAIQLDDAELRRLWLVCVLGIPLLPLAIGAGVWWRRRR